MKQLVFLSLCLLSTTCIFSQTGTIRGTIYDAKTEETVPFASVYIAENGSGTTSDLDGAYFMNVPSGSYSLNFSFIGYASTNVKAIDVTSGNVTIIDIRLEEESELLEEVVIVGRQMGNTEAAILTIQRKSPNLLDGISSQAFSRTGDSDAAGAIKRVTGVSVEGGKYVFVRGLGDRYTKSILNDMDIPGLDPDRNTLQMDIFPTSIIDNILVLKSFTPDLPGDFTGGVVNIITKDFPERKTFNISLGLGFNPNMHFKSDYLTYDGGATDFLGADDGSRDLPFDKKTVIPSPARRDPNLTSLTSSFSNNWAAQRRSNTMNFNFGLSTGNQINKKKVTLGYNAVLNYRNETVFFDDVEYGAYQKPDANELFELDAERIQTGELGSNNVLLTGLLGGVLKVRNHKFTLSVMRLQNGESKAGIFNQSTFISGVSEIKRDNLEYSEKAISNALLTGRHSFLSGQWEVDWKLSPTYSQIEDKDIRLSPFRVEGGRYTIEPSEGAVPRRLFRNLEELNLTGKIDITTKFEVGSEEAKLKFGFSNSFKKRNYEILSYQFDIQRPDQIVFSGDPNELLRPENIWTPDTRSGVYVEGNFEPANSYTAEQNVIGAYVMNELPISNRLRAIYGLRLEKFDHIYSGQNNQGTEFYKNRRLLEELNLLPSANVVYAITNDMNVRVSFSRTLARPSFKELSLAQIFDAVSDRTFIGNLDLVQTDIDNFDLRWELFQPGGQMFAISGFYKRFQNPIEIVAFSEVAPNDLTPRNVGDAKVLGVELEIRKNLGFIGPKLELFSLGTNVTIVNSEVQLDDSQGGEYTSRLRNARSGELIGTTRRMQGQSPYIVNSVLNYTNPNNGWEANLSYNVQGKRLAVVGISQNPDVFEKPFHALNIKISKLIGLDNKIRLSLSANNLLGQKRLRVYKSFGALDRVFDRFTPHRSFSLGFGWRL